jgi:hypothetical protein
MLVAHGVARIAVFDRPPGVLFLETAVFKQTCSFAVASFAAVLVTGASAPAVAASVPGCRNQANSPLVVRRVLPTKHSTTAVTNSA